MTQFMDRNNRQVSDHTQRFKGSEEVQAEMARLATALAESPAWTGAHFEAKREAERQASEELAEQLHEWNTGTRQRNVRSARHNLWN